MKYAKYLPEFKRRENWDEIVDRYSDMHIKKYPLLAEEIRAACKFLREKKVFPSMRSLQFGGKPIELSPNRAFNCAFMPMDNPLCFAELMFLLLGGTGLGYSVQRHHVEKLPAIKGVTKRTKRYLINDSIEGWADAVKTLVLAYFNGESDPVYDFSDIRDKGTLLKTSGGKAPGPQPLKDCLHNLRKILDTKKPGDKLTSLEVHDINCYIADAVLAGGIRRAALLALFSIDDEEMLTCKFGDWADLNPQRARANNSAMVVRHKIKKSQFDKLWAKVKASGSGEPGVYFSNNAEWGCNPCCEIGLRAYQFCNLSTINASNITSQEDLNARARAAAFIGTLQASYTNFHYLRDIWQETTEKDALIGVSMTGIADGTVLNYSLTEAAEIVITENKRVAKLIKINPAARTTCIKPEGTVSLVAGTASGIHGRHSKRYIRRIRILKNEAIYQYLKDNMPKLIEDDFYKSKIQAIISLPIESPDGSIYRTESALKLLDRVKKFSDQWVHPGHIKGDNTHNVSATITIKDSEWDEVGEWMWKNKEFYNGLSVLPFDGGNYIQAPFEECSKAKYEELLDYVSDINLDNVIESTDATNLQGEIACGALGCDIR